MDEQSKSTDIANWALATAGLGGIAALVAAFALPRGGWIAMAILILLALFIGGYTLWRRFSRMKASDQFNLSINQEAARTPREIKDPNRQAELDKLRKRFLDGIQIYRSRGKDIYSVPWYAIIGESGSGKTEAIRHSNLDFPPGLNDFMQGAGGTLNMDWWFTNHGVILDTAGAMVFPETGSDRSVSPQWQEFLKLLKKHRPHCPLNGLILVLSVDSLISDSASTIAQKAGRIARQLDVIQSALDVRFPVSLLVTKCDKLTGFRELFDHIDDPELQDQMLGWSNPESLDVPFRPDLVDQYLAQVLQRLRKRRLGLMRDPVPTRGARGRRADEVDALYALPKSLSLIAPRLRRYLEAIFVAGEFSSKPLFVRGIYFTSAMQVGADLDEAVWAALGRPAEMGAASAQKEDLGRPFFLRDLFLEKVFRERGLVTRASNTRKMLRNRKLSVVGYATGCLALLVMMGWFGKRGLQRAIGQQSAAWKVAAQEDGWKDGAWNPIVVRDKLDPNVYSYTNSLAANGVRIPTFHLNLRKYAETNIRSWVFLPVSWIKNVSAAKRQEAQTIVFEHGVIRPLVLNTRARMQSPAADKSSPPEYQADALKALIRLEAEVARKQSIQPTNTADVGANYLLPYLTYLTRTNQFPLLTDLQETFVRTYGPGKSSKWPPEKISAGDSLATNRAIARGLEQFLINAQSSEEALATQSADLKALSQAVANFKREEARWHQAGEERKSIEQDMFAALQRAKESVDQMLKAAKANKLLMSDTDTLLSAQQQIATKAAAAGRKAVQQIRMAMGDPLPNTQLFTDIEKSLASFEVRLTNSTTFAVVPAQDLEDHYNGFLQFDRDHVTRCYDSRFQMYTQAYTLQQTVFPDMASQIGRGLDFLVNVKSSAKAIADRNNSYQGGYEGKLRQTCGWLVSDAEAKVTARYIQAYCDYVNRELTTLANTSVRPVKVERVRNALDLQSRWRKDLSHQSKIVLPQTEENKLIQLGPIFESKCASVISAYAQDARGQLGAQLGFPVFRNPSAAKTLTEEELSQLNQVVAQFDSDVKELLQSDANQPDLKKLRDKVTQCEHILNALISTNNDQRLYKITVDPAKNDENSLNLIRRYYGLSISSNGTKADVRNISTTAQTFGPFRPADRLTVSVTRFPENPRSFSFTNTIPIWAGLRLRAASAEKGGVNSDGPDGLLQITSNPGDVIRVLLQFNPALPSDSDWPTADEWAK
jgi:hypothetical protein